MLLSIYKPFSKWIDRHQTSLKNRMEPRRYRRNFRPLRIGFGEDPFLSGYSRRPNQNLNRYRQIGFLKEAGVEINPYEYITNQSRIDTLLRDGVFHEDKKMRYWVERDNKECFAIYARGLYIDNSDRSEFWRWPTDNSAGVEVAEVLRTKWLGVRGTFSTVNLLHQLRYKVTFQLKTTPSSTMKGQMVNLKLTLPDGTNQEKQEPLPEPDNDSWRELEVGRFKMTLQNTGEMRFSMERLFETWESGLIIKGVEIKPE